MPKPKNMRLRPLLPGIHFLLTSLVFIALFAVSCGRADGAGGTGSIDEGRGEWQAPSASVLESALSKAAAGVPDDLEKLARNSGGGAWFALAAAAEDSGYDTLAEELRIRSVEDDPAPFQRLSLEQVLADNPQALKHPSRALRQAEQAASEMPATPESTEGLRRARIAILVSRGKQKALARELEFFSGSQADAPVLAAALQSGNRDTRSRAEALLPGYLASVESPDLMHLFRGIVEPPLEQLRSARESYSAGDYRAALNGYRIWITAGAPPAGLDRDSIGRFSPLFSEIADSARFTGREAEWADLLERAATVVSGEHRFSALYESAQLYQELGDIQSAGENYVSAADSIPSGLLRDRALWQNLGLYSGGDSATPETEYQSYLWSLSRWDNPNRFVDRLDDYIHRLVGASEWQRLERFYTETRSFLPPVAGARTALILAWAISDKELKSQFTISELLEYASGESPLSWAGLRAAGLLGEDIRIVHPAGDTPRLSAAGSSDEDKIIDLFLQWEMVDSCYSRVLAHPQIYSEQSIRAVSAALAAQGYPRRSIRIIGLLLSRDGYRPTPDDLRLRYPLPFGTLARAAAEVYQVPPEVFFGLIRTESAWDTVAVSRSGARGLAQFMPATWEEWLERLRYPKDTSPDDPVVNLTLAAAYLEWLYEREWTNGWSEVLIAYNAGGGRLRSWRRERTGFGEHLFVESVPFEEPRSYVRKVLSAATLYGYLYADASPAELHRQWGLGGLSAEIFSEE